MARAVAAAAAAAQGASINYRAAANAAAFFIGNKTNFNAILINHLLFFYNIVLK